MYEVGSQKSWPPPLTKLYPKTKPHQIFINHNHFNTANMDDEEGSHRPNAEWPTPNKTRVKTLYHNSHFSKKVIARTILDMTVSTVRRILKSDTTHRTGTNRSGRPYILTPEQVDQVIQFLGKNFQRRALPWRNLVAECGLDYSPDTLRRELANRGYHKCVAYPKPFIFESARQQPLEFVMEHKH